MARSIGALLNGVHLLEFKIAREIRVVLNMFVDEDLPSCGNVAGKKPLLTIMSCMLGQVDGKKLYLLRLEMQYNSIVGWWREECCFTLPFRVCRSCRYSYLRFVV